MAEDKPTVLPRFISVYFSLHLVQNSEYQTFFFSPGCCLFQLYITLAVRIFLVPLLSLQLQFLVFLDQYFLFHCRFLFHILFLNIFLVFFICIICLYSSFFHLLVYILLDNCFLPRFFDILFLLLLAMFLNQLIVFFIA